MNELLEHKPTRRAHFSLLLNREEYITLTKLSEELGISRGGVLRCAVKNLLNTKNAGTVKNSIVEIDAFWKTFRGGH